MSTLGIDFQNISFSFGQKTILSGVSFHARAGKFTALIGPNGAGKSTIFHLLCGLLYPKSGQVLIAGFTMGTVARKNLGLVFQQNTLDLELTVEQNLKYFAAMQGLQTHKINERIEAVLTQMGIAQRRNERVQNINGGHRRRLEISRALLHEPKVLVLDEPTVGLDLASKIAITDHAHMLANSGITVLWITHLIDEILDGDDVHILQKGSLIASGECRTMGGTAELKKYLEGERL